MPRSRPLPPAAMRGFTLIELSIVLIIIGLLVGGIMAGQALIKSAEVKSVISDISHFKSAIATFKKQYKALPGDMLDATDYWGMATTANGNGNGAIDYLEGYHLWQQLALAGFIPGSYTGVPGPDTPGVSPYDTLPGINVPKGQILDTGYWFYDWGDQAGGAVFYQGNYTNVMIYGKRVSGSWPYHPALSGNDAHAIDAKLDDGSPALGNIRTLTQSWTASNGGECPTSDTPALAAYPLSGDSNAPRCFLIFLDMTR